MPFQTLSLLFAGLTAIAQAPTPSLTRLTLLQRGAQHLAVQAFNNDDWGTALPLFTQLAALGDARAETDLGEMYYRGLGVPQDEDRAFALQMQAVAQHYGKAEDNLGTMYANRGDQISATHWYWLAAQDGDASGAADLGWQFHRGNGMPRDDSKADHWFNVAAAQGNPAAEYGLGLAYVDGTGVAPDDQHAMTLFRAAAAQGEGVAMCQIGALYQQGDGVARDYAAAMRWYRQAADWGTDCGYTGVGFLYDLGLGVPRSESIALKWYEAAARDGDAIGENDVGAMYHRGAGGLPQDFAKAAYWFGLAADQGEAYGETNLATLYLNGQGVAHDDLLGFNLDQQAAAQNEPHAQEQLGNAYRLGYATRIDFAQAAKFYTAAAGQGLVQSQAALSYLYETGQGVPRDYGAAYKWLLISQNVAAHPIIEDDERCKEFAALAVPDAADILRHLTPAQAAQARLDAAAWGARHRPLQDAPPPPVRRVPLWPFCAVTGILAALLAWALFGRRPEA